ncbi:MAG: hypothetical protein FWG68_12075 [Defluviitaleaceae bacterium]|nr:hypothetical protein [Defluviitaleaceae bacterium]
MDTLEDYLREIEEILDSCKKVPLTSRISVDKEEIYKVITEIRLNLPSEIRQAQRIIDQHDDILSEAHLKADTIVKAAEEEAKALTSEHEIYLRANEQATELIAHSKNVAKEYNQQIVEYADDLLVQTDTQIKEASESIAEQIEITTTYLNDLRDALYENRKTLRG